MITLAIKSMLPALKALWVEAFEDPEAYADFFFEHRFNDISTFVYLIDNIPVSMAFVFDEELCYNGNYVNDGYIYGVATAKTHQGNGYSTEILKHIQSLYPTTFLIPATKRLFDFYSRNGYKTAFLVKEETLLTSDNYLLEQWQKLLTKDANSSFQGETAGNILTGFQKELAICPPGIQLNMLEQANIPYSFDIISPKEYKIIRDNHFQREGYLRWSEASIAYAIAENNFWGGSTLKVTSLSDNLKGVILYRCYNEQLYIKETTLSGQYLYDVAFHLMKENKVNKCHLRLSWDGSTTTSEFGMLHSSLHIKNGYCNLVLD
jgi:GNAT superfamily N-acetyltransferase